MESVFPPEPHPFLPLEAFEDCRHKGVREAFGQYTLGESQCNNPRFLSTIPIDHPYGLAVACLEAC